MNDRMNTALVGLRMRYLMLVDLVSISVAIVLSFVIRFETIFSLGTYIQQYWSLFVLVMLVYLPLYYKFGLYRRLWRYAGTGEFKRIILAGLAGAVIIFVINFGLFPLINIPYCPSRSVFIIMGILIIGFMGISRFLLRLQQERMSPQDVTRLKAFVQNPLRVLIMGAGDAGAIILRELQTNPGLGIKVVGFLDDNKAKHGMHIHEVAVLGTRENIPELVKKDHIDEIIIAMPTAPGEDIRAIKTICDHAKVKYRITPGIYELIQGTAVVKQIRDVQIEDLLRREPIEMAKEEFAYLKGRVVLITGAGGSIGSELCRQVAQQAPKMLILLDQAETPLYAIDLKLRGKYPQLELHPVIVDVRDRNRLERVFGLYQPEVVFHAAAYKHVPMMEDNPEEAILNNVLGMCNLIWVAERHEVDRFVLISTDKAVNPANFMGASKRIAELLLQDAAQRSGRNFVAVRFGNVLGSQGSVIPLFKSQITAGGPITVTHPDMTRYFMTIPEAVQLVIEAATLGNGGEIFVLDMGTPVKIVDLARDLIALSGLQPDQDIKIVYTGLRPGEKLDERLFGSMESYTLTTHKKIFIVKGEGVSDSQKLQWGVQELIKSAQAGETDKFWDKIRVVVPECQPKLSNGKNHNNKPPAKERERYLI